MSGNVVKTGNGEALRQTGWEEVANMSKNAYRNNKELTQTDRVWQRNQEKEVMYALLKKDYSKVGMLGEGLTKRDEMEYYDRVLDGRITEKDQYEMLRHVLRSDQVQEKINPGLGNRKVMERITGRDSMNAEKEINPVMLSNKLKLLCLMSGGVFSPEGGMGASEFDVGHLVDRYETALDFEKDRTRAIDKITGIFPPSSFMDINKQRAELSAAFDELREDVYGLQASFVDAMARLADKAYRPYWEGMNSSRRLFKSASVRVTSERQYERMKNPDDSMRNGWSTMITIGKEDGSSQDSAYGDGEENVFAVFDGVGGSDNGREASRGCVKRLSDFMEDVDFTTDNGKVRLMQALHNSIQRGSTTGLVTKIVANEYGGKTLHYAAVGDSRLYIVHRDGGAEQITNDDSVTDEMIHNSEAGKRFTMDEIRMLREEAEKGQMRNIKEERTIQNHILHSISNGLGGDFRGISEGNMGAVLLEEGDQIILCSDGISGDTRSERIDMTGFSMLCRGREADMATYNLMLAAAKDDDRTAMVINV